MLNLRCFKHNDFVFTKQLRMLFDDIKLYKLCVDQKSLHAGDLYEHSLWSYYAFIGLLNDSPYSEGLVLSLREKKIIPIAALLHDIGKAGRVELFDENNTHGYKVCMTDNNVVDHISYYSDSQEHVLNGFQYLAGHFLNNKKSNFLSKNYRLNNGKIFDFYTMFKELSIDENEQKLIAILVGMHYEFGNFVQNIITEQQFLEKLQNFVQAVNYNNNVVNDRLVQLCVLVQVADVQGLTPVSWCCNSFFPKTLFLEQRHVDTLRFSNPLYDFGYSKKINEEESVCLQKMHQLLACVKKNIS